MLTEKEYGLLSRYVPQLYTGPGTDEYTKHFRALGYIRPAGYQLQGGGTSTNPTVWAITPAGLAALQVFDEVAKQHAEDKAEKKKDRAFNVFLALLGTVFGLVLEYLVHAVDKIVGLIG